MRTTPTFPSVLVATALLSSGCLPKSSEGESPTGAEPDAGGLPDGGAPDAGDGGPDAGTGCPWSIPVEPAAQGDYRHFSHAVGTSVVAVAIANGGYRAVAGGQDGVVYAFDRSSAAPRFSFALGDQVNTVAMARDGSAFVAAASGKIALFACDATTPTWTYDTQPDLASGNAVVDGVAMSADGAVDRGRVAPPRLPLRPGKLDAAREARALGRGLARDRRDQRRRQPHGRRNAPRRDERARLLPRSPEAPLDVHHPRSRLGSQRFADAGRPLRRRLDRRRRRARQPHPPLPRRLVDAGLDVHDRHGFAGLFRRPLRRRPSPRHDREFPALLLRRRDGRDADVHVRRQLRGSVVLRRSGRVPREQQRAG